MRWPKLVLLQSAGTERDGSATGAKASSYKTRHPRPLSLTPSIIPTVMPRVILLEFCSKAAGDDCGNSDDSYKFNEQELELENNY